VKLAVYVLLNAKLPITFLLLKLMMIQSNHHQ